MATVKASTDLPSSTVTTTQSHPGLCVPDASEVGGWPTVPTKCIGKSSSNRGNNHLTCLDPHILMSHDTLRPADWKVATIQPDSSRQYSHFKLLFQAVSRF